MPFAEHHVFAFALGSFLIVLLDVNRADFGLPTEFLLTIFIERLQKLNEGVLCGSI